MSVVNVIDMRHFSAARRKGCVVSRENATRRNAAESLCPQTPVPSTCYHVCVRWVVILMISLGVAQAAPIVEIKAKTQLGLTHVKLRDTGQIEVVGQLVDKLTGEGIAGQTVEVTIAGHHEFGST